MKVDIQKYIQGCLQCQLKKLIRVETKNPMVITGTPTTTFEKISMIIGGSLPETKSGNTTTRSANTSKRETYFSKRKIENIL